MRVKLGASFWWLTAIILVYLVITTTLTLPWFQKPLTPVNSSMPQSRNAHENINLLKLFKDSIETPDENTTEILFSANYSSTTPAGQDGSTGFRTERRHVAFLKVHKTASSTAQNVFLRFGDSRGLTFVLAHTHGEAKFLNVISYVNSITDSNIVPPPDGKQYDLLCCHVLYDRKSFEKVLPRDTAYIGIVREPVSRFRSAVNFFSPGYILRIKSDFPVGVYAKDPLKYEPDDPRMSWTNNRMAVEFGFPRELFPGRNKSESKSAVNEYLRKLGKEFDFIIVSEHFDESMVLMKRILGWSLKDILYMNQNARSYKSSRKTLPDIDDERIHKFLYLDQALYDFAVQRFKRLVETEGESLKNEVIYFKKVRKNLETFCKNYPTENDILKVPESEWNNAFDITKRECLLFTKDEKAFLQKQRMRMYGTLNN